MTTKSFSHKGIDAAFKVTDSNWAIDVKIKGWVRRRSYQLIFDASDLDQLKSALLICLDASSYQELGEGWITEADNLSWWLFGFHRTHKFSKTIEFPTLAYSDEISLLGMSQSKSRSQTQVTDAFIGHRKGEKYLLLRIAHYVSQGIGNMSGSSPDTAVIQLQLLSDLIKEV